MRRAVLVVLGAYVSLLGAVVHRHVWFADGVSWPWGLVIAVAATFAIARAADLWIRVGAAWFALGWALVLLGLQYSPGGSYLIASDWLGLTFSAGSLGAIVLVMVKPPRVEE